MNYVIGAGGVGTWLVPQLIRLSDQVTILDGDKYEEKNLDRQFFKREFIGKNKAEALSRIYNQDRQIPFIPEYFYQGMNIEFTSEDILFCCADNHPCRRAVLAVCDQCNCRAILGANEYIDAEAYWYESSFRDTINDPRKIYPVIMSDRTGDPLGPQGCTGEAAQAAPQLVLANNWASTFMLHLYWFHTKQRKDIEKAYWPIHHKGNDLKYSTIRFGDRLKT